MFYALSVPNESEVQRSVGYVSYVAQMHAQRLIAAH